MLEAMEQISNEERLTFISDLIVGTGNAKRGAAQEHMNALQRKQQRLATTADLESMGIQVDMNG